MDSISRSLRITNVQTAFRHRIAITPDYSREWHFTSTKLSRRRVRHSSRVATCESSAGSKWSESDQERSGRTCAFTWRSRIIAGRVIRHVATSCDYASVRNRRTRLRENVPLVVTLIAGRWMRATIIREPSPTTMSVVAKTGNGGTLACWPRPAATREPLFQWGKRQSTSFPGEGRDRSAFNRGTEAKTRLSSQMRGSTSMIAARYIPPFTIELSIRMSYGKLGRNWRCKWQIRRVYKYIYLESLSSRFRDIHFFPREGHKNRKTQRFSSMLLQTRF